MKRNCPNSNCLYFKKSNFVVKNGSFFRRCDSRTIQRYKCKACQKRFSSSTGKPEYRQQKRRENPKILRDLCSNVSLRRIALNHNLSVGTVCRRLKYLGKKSRIKNEKAKLKIKNKVTHMQFDDLITKENSKLKPLSVSIAVDADTRYVLAAFVSEIPAFGHLAKKGRKKYPKRSCHHKEGLTRLFENIKENVNKEALIRSDEHKKYPEFVSQYFPKAKYERYPSRRATIAGQGEMKEGKHDPIYFINHTCAMFRANINRLTRRTWCTTKDPKRLQDHLDIFINFYNTILLKTKLI